MKTTKRVVILAVFVAFVMTGFLLPEPKGVPVAGAQAQDWHPKSFWYEPWGSSGVHKGVDIFADRHTAVIAPTHLWVVYRGTHGKGGRVVLALGPKWRVHYFAHLGPSDESFMDASGLVSAGSIIGVVGDSGNARGKSPHLHYSIVSLLPMPWRIDGSPQGYKKAFYLNPIQYFSNR